MLNKIANEKIKQACDYLAKSEADLWLIYSSEGSDPAVSLLTGLKTVGKTFFLLLGDGTRICIASIIDVQEHEDSGLFSKVIGYRDDPADILQEVVDKINPNKIMLNFSLTDYLCDGITAGRFRYLETTLCDYADKFVSSEAILSRVRSIKSPEEISMIMRAIEITQDIYGDVFAAVRPGMTEYEVGKLFVEGMKKRGVINGVSKDLSMPIVMKDRISHRDPGDAVINPGDFLIFDFGVSYNGYCADIARTAYFLKEGESRAPERFEDMFDAAHNAITKAFQAIMPGVEGWTVDDAARSYLHSRGMPDITHSTGHQVGQFVHDGGAMFAPRWERYGQAAYGIIEAGMVLTLEPTILNPDGDFSVLCEENILVTDSGAEFLSVRQDELILIPFSH